MTSFRSWLDRLLGRDKATAEGAAMSMREPTDATAPNRVDELEDAAAASREESVDREPMQPPGTG